VDKEKLERYKEQLKNIILEQQKQGDIVLKTPVGVRSIKLNKFIQQPIEGILYDLNKLPETILTHTDNLKWINDYAAYLVIKELKADRDALLSAAKKTNEIIKVRGESYCEGIGAPLSDWEIHVPDWAHFIYAKNLTVIEQTENRWKISECTCSETIDIYPTEESVCSIHGAFKQPRR